MDVEAGHIYWTDMGFAKENDGSIERVELDGQNRMSIVPAGGTFTPKQVHFEKKSGKLYWISDPESRQAILRPTVANPANRSH